MKESFEEEKKSEINKNYLIIGPRIIFPEYEDLNKDFNIHGDGQKTVEIEKISIEEGSRIVINAHGNTSGGKHQIALYSSIGYESGLDFTSYNFECLKKQCNVELFSCHSGSAICNIGNLPKNSTLITFIDDKYTTWAVISQKLIKMSVNFLQPENPFTRFASFLATNADDTRFAINIDMPHRSFRSDINSLENFSNEDIRAWQKEKISEFINFINEAKNHSNDSNKEKIEQFTELVKDEDHLNQFINKFDVNLYRRMLVMNLITQGKIESIESCLDHIEITNEDHIFINMATHQGHKEILELLLERGFDLNRISKSSPPLLIAVKDGNTAIVNLLLEHKAYIEQQDESGHPPLYIAAHNRDIEMVKLLLEKGAEVDPVDKSGRTPFYIAADKGDTGIVKLLLKQGAKIDPVDKSDRTPLYIAADKGDTEIVKLLLEKGAKIGPVNILGSTPLYIAVEKGYIEIVKLFFLDNQVDKSDHNPLFIATHNGNLEMVTLLLANKYNIDYQNESGLTTLSLAVDQGHIEIVKLLLEKGAKTDQVDDLGHNPLFIAIFNDNIEIVKLLLEQGTKIDLVDNSGRTPLSIATKRKNIEMVNLLSASQKLQEELVKDSNLYIKENTEQSRGDNIKILEEDRKEYSALSVKEAVIEYASQGKDKDLKRILEAFPDPKDRVDILNEAISITSDQKAAQLLIRVKLQDILNLTSPSKEEAKIKNIERKNKSSRGI